MWRQDTYLLDILPVLDRILEHEDVRDGLRAVLPWYEGGVEGCSGPVSPGSAMLPEDGRDAYYKERNAKVKELKEAEEKLKKEQEQEQEKEQDPEKDPEKEDEKEGEGDTPISDESQLDIKMTATTRTNETDTTCTEGTTIGAGTGN